MEVKRTDSGARDLCANPSSALCPQASDLASLVLVSMSVKLYLHGRTDKRNPQLGIYKVS